MAKTIEKTVETDPPKAPADPKARLKLWLFFARFIITLAAMALFGLLIFEVLGQDEEMTASSKDIVMLGLGAFLPILGAVAKFWLDPDDLHGDESNGNSPQPPTKEA